MSKKIIFHCSPPALLNMASPALSVLKGFLRHYGYASDIVYWNFLFYDLQKKFIFTQQSLSNHPNPLLLFLNYIAIENNDKKLFQDVKASLISFAPEKLLNSNNFFEQYMYEYKAKVDLILDDYIDKYKLSEALYFGFTLKFEQWVFAYMLAIKLKRMFANIPIVVGGMNNKDSARSFLESFPQFDIAMWGEGEYAVLELTKQLLNENAVLKIIPNIIYRDNTDLVCSDISTHNYADLSDMKLFSDFSDYCVQKHYYPTIRDCALPIEISRGCHWNRCHFCYLNTGYKYRRKSLDKIKKEILFYIETYSINLFATTDNDLIGADLAYFNQLLDVLIEIKNRYPKFLIVIAEIVTKGLDKSTIKKIAKAGIVTVQIGYENASNELLTKIEKINSFASNILFLKFAQHYKINITGLNVLYNLFEENNENILEAIINLKFLRFFRYFFGVRHKMTPLTINSTSRYCKKFEINKSEWYPINTTAYYLKDHWKGDSSWHVLDFAKLYRNPLWNSFENADKYFLENRHTYQLKYNSDKIIVYENRNDILISSFEIEIRSVQYQILLLTNDKVVSLEWLHANLNNYNRITKSEIMGIIDKFYDNGIIYHNKDFSEIVSILDI